MCCENIVHFLRKIEITEIYLIRFQSLHTEKLHSVMPTSLDKRKLENLITYHRFLNAVRRVVRLPSIAVNLA